jgi:hypothetical protein
MSRTATKLTEKHLAMAFLATAALAANAFAEPAKRNTKTAKTYTFDRDPPGKPPVGWAFARTRNVGAAGTWVVSVAKDAPSGGRALAQLDEDDTNGRYPLAIAPDDAPADLRISVKCKAVSGDVDQACGLVFRYQDENNYYVTRSNALEGNVRLYFVKDGKRTQIATWDGKVPGKGWNELAAEAKGDVLRVFFNGKQVIQHQDGTFSGGGKVGLWTKADSVTYFDDLTVSVL